jgi:hypothetical protein
VATQANLDHIAHFSIAVAESEECRHLQHVADNLLGRH